MSTVCEWFDLKTTRTVSRRFSLKTGDDGFSDLASKPVVGSSLSLKIKVVEGFPVWASKLTALVW
jgi:hypothetical protein